MNEKKKENELLTGQEQTIIELIKAQNQQFDKVNGTLEGIENRIAHIEGFEGKLNALQKGVSNLQSVKKDVSEIKTDVNELKTDMKQVKTDVDTIASDLGYKRNAKKQLKSA